jgi:hypothetical protein
MELPSGDQQNIYGTLKGYRRFFSPQDDDTLRQLKTDLQTMTWAQIADLMPGFTARQLRERWCNYLCPSLKTSRWTDDEDLELMRLYAELGPLWGIIGRRMGNRSAPDIKNRFHAVRNRTEKSGRRPKREQQETIQSLSLFGNVIPELIVRARQQPREPPSDQLRTPTLGPVNFSIKSILV